MNSLVAHVDSKYATRDEVFASPTPVALTRTHKIVPHREVIEEVMGEMVAMGLAVAKERYSLTKGGNRMFGVIDTTDAIMPSDMGIAIGVRNSHDKSMQLGVAAGTRVFVCDNLSFNGEVVRHRRHTRGIVPSSVIRGALTQVVDQAHRQAAWCGKLKEVDLADGKGKVMLVDAFDEGALTLNQFGSALRLWLDGTWIGAKGDAWVTRSPEHTAWGLYQCCTEVYRSAGPDRTLARSARLNRVFGRLVALPAAPTVEPVTAA